MLCNTDMNLGHWSVKKSGIYLLLSSKIEYVCICWDVCIYSSLVITIFVRAVVIIQWVNLTDLPPPCIWQRYGNRHTFPSPTAYDTHASTNCLGLSQLGLGSFSMSASWEWAISLSVLNNWTTAIRWRRVE